MLVRMVCMCIVRTVVIILQRICSNKVDRARKLRHEETSLEKRKGQGVKNDVSELHEENRFCIKKRCLVFLQKKKA